MNSTVSVLLVDDRVANLVALEAVLAPLGLRVVRALSGLEALRALLDDEFAVVLLDVQMPGMSGLELAGLIRQREATRATPILFLTAEPLNAGDVAEAYRQGAADFLPKPLDPDVLRAKVSVFVQLHQQRVALQEQAVALARAEAAEQREREANRLKDDFLATLSHELRTPLNSILGWASMLMNDELRDEALVRKALPVIHRNARAQAAIIEDLLDVSRIVSGSLRIDPRSAVLDRAVHEALEVVHHAAAAKGVELVFRPESEPCELVADPDRLRQIVWNLLSNAVKFTPRGGKVEVCIDRRQSAAVLTVTDTGQGIEPAMLPRVFDRFWQASTSSRRQGGLGLGLAIVRHLVELHGGQVAVESEGVGRGARFIITLPIRAVALPAREARRAPALLGGLPEAPATDLAGCRVLVVDDTDDAREVLTLVLKAQGAVVHAADSASAALGAVPSFKPDVLVTDIGMPHEDGYALVRRLRAEHPAFGALPVLALTAYARREDVERAEASGIETYLRKPVCLDELTAAIARAAGRLPRS